MEDGEAYQSQEGASLVRYNLIVTHLDQEGRCNCLVQHQVEEGTHLCSCATDATVEQEDILPFEDGHEVGVVHPVNPFCLANGVFELDLTGLEVQLVHPYYLLMAQPSYHHRHAEADH